MKKDLIQILVFQVLAIPIVILLFKFIEPRKVAAIFASIVFISFGIFALWKLYRWPNFHKELLFWLFAVNFFVLTLPIFLTRILNWDSDFETLTTMGISALMYHTISTRFGMVILLVVFYKLFKLRRIGY